MNPPSSPDASSPPATPASNQAREVVGGVNVLLDVTEQRNAGELQSRLAAIVESSDDAIVSKDLNGVIRTWNAGAERLFGYTAAEAIGQPVMMLIPPENSDEEPAILNRIRRGERIDHYETIRRRKNGTPVAVSLSVSPIRDSNGKVVGASKIARDITERKQAAEAAQLLAAIVESSDDAIISKDLHGTILSWNSGAERLYGYTAAEAIGQAVTMLIPEDCHDEEPAILARIRRGERVDHYETTRQRKDGTIVDVSISVSPLTDTTGRVIGASKIARDITDQKRTQREMAKAHATAVAASRAKDDFLAALSHELRTPLNPVLLVASSASEDVTVPENLRADFALIRKNVELEARLIDDLLDLTRITRGKLRLNFSPHDLHVIVKDAIATIQSELGEKHIEFNVALAPTPPLVNVDPVRLLQVLWNVLKNAVKFTPMGGSILVETRTVPEDQRVIVTVTDSGIGMTETELNRAFDAFAQGEHGGSHRFGGLGLGLTISRKLLELHHGSIQAVSEGRDRGSTLIIDLPLLASRMDAARSGPPAASSGSTPRILSVLTPPSMSKRGCILLVEDHESTRVALAHLLKRRGYDVIAAGSATEARALAAHASIDLVVSDIGLPDGSGYDLMAELSAARNVFGIALTGYGTEHDVARSLAVGFSQHLTKPVTIQALDQALASLRAS